MPWLKHYVEGGPLAIKAVKSEFDSLFSTLDSSHEMLLVQQTHGPGSVTLWLWQPAGMISGVSEEFAEVEDDAIPKKATLLNGNPQKFERFFLSED
jgi:hypothetical protein